ncbi:hypothetical protein FSPOR_11058 [Fusarium sporotrichioides]|uniref:Uncharacterized protein n=1 Tax=Fusarium sporotrichioides TaxID=5514 RepID=A0A395RI88_FUSSP|nr:hypothetical protein FSPOR_11058 [Fusarium sporotrichioides]
MASPILRLFLGVTAAIIFIAIFTPTESVTSVAQSFTMPLALRNLEVVISQEEKNPVLMRTAVKNNNDHPVTILSYGSPLDALAIQLGTLYITPKGGSEPLEILQIEASRLWPPMEDALIELGAGQTAIWESTLQEPVVPMDSVFEGATVQLKGTWTAVWPREKEGIDFSELEEGTPINGTLTGSYKSNVLDIEVA